MTGGPATVGMGRPGQDGRPAPDLSGYTIGVVGLGTMGGGMAVRLAETGASLRLYNRTDARARAVAGESGARAVVASSPAEAADGADLVLVSVADDSALDAVLLGVAGVSQAVGPPGVVINATTVAPDTVRRLGKHVPLLDAGVLGNGEHARTGLLRWYVGGADEVLRLARAVLDALGQQVVHVGELGSGMMLKLVMNLLMGVEMQALAELTALGASAGLDRQVVLDAVVESGFAAPVMRFKARRIATESYQHPDFRLRLMAKDLALAFGEATAHGTALPMTAAVAATHQRAVETGIGDLDCAAIARFMEHPTEERPE